MINTKKSEINYLKNVYNRIDAVDWELYKPFFGKNPLDLYTGLTHIYDFVVAVSGLGCSNGDCILDIGSGSCWISDWLNKLNIKTVSLDISVDMLKIGKKRLVGSSNLVVGDFENLPFHDKTFDGVICIDSLHHVPNIQKALYEIHRILKDGGTFVCSEPGIGHSEAYTSKMVMRKFGVLEQDIIIDEIIKMLTYVGFNNLFIKPNLFPDLKLDYLSWKQFLSRKQYLKDVKSNSYAHPVIGAIKGKRVFNSAMPNILKAKLDIIEMPHKISSDCDFQIRVKVKNIGDTIWKKNMQSIKGGYVCCGAKLLDKNKNIIIQDYGRSRLNFDLQPGKTAIINLILRAPIAGCYFLKLDMVDEGITWFEERGSKSILIPIEVKNSSVKEGIKKVRIVFVAQRYGLEVNGGAELHCRQVAEHLSKYFDVEVITTCAIDYITWENEYPPGKEVLNGLTIWRFPVDYPRDVTKFNRFSEKIFGQRHTREEEIQWMKLQGPYSTKLFEFIEKNKEKYDHFIFFTYLYCTTFFGLPLVNDKAILVPTAHDEPPIYLDIFNSLFDMPAAIVYNTEEEKQFVTSKFNNAHIFSDVVGVGIDVPKNMQPANFRKEYNIYDDFIIYVGRIAESKGCKELFDYFLRYKKETKSDIKLVLIGKPEIKIPKHEDIIPFGFVSEEDKFNGIGASELLVMPSIYESLSMVLMEAWVCKKAVLVNGQCEVLKGHCLRSNAGLWYENYEEFKECLDLLHSNENLRDKMGENGKKYANEYYIWENVEEKYLRLL